MSTLVQCNGHKTCDKTNCIHKNPHKPGSGGYDDDCRGSCSYQYPKEYSCISINNTRIKALKWWKTLSSKKKEELVKLHLPTIPMIMVDKSSFMIEKIFLSIVSTKEK